MQHWADSAYCCSDSASMTSKRMAGHCWQHLLIVLVIGYLQAVQRNSQRTVKTSAAVASAPSVEDFRAASRTLLPAIPELHELAACNDPDLLHLFFLVFCSQGVAMTDKVRRCRL